MTDRRFAATLAGIALLGAILPCKVGCGDTSEPVAIAQQTPVERVLWSDDFEGTTGPIQDHDPTWKQVLGQLDVSAADGAVLANPGREDGGDDYGYHPQPATEVTITADLYWDSVDAAGVILVSPPGAVEESLYELTIFQDQLRLYRYDGGGDPSVYALLAASDPLGLSSGSYRVVMRARYASGFWTISGELRDPGAGFAVIASIPDTYDPTHGPSIGQGIGIYDNSQESSRIDSMTVTTTDVPEPGAALASAIAVATLAGVGRWRRSRGPGAG